LQGKNKSRTGDKGLLARSVCLVVIEEFDLDKAKKPNAKRVSSDSSDGAHFFDPTGQRGLGRKRGR
jgi:hypothetical protein